MDDGGFLDPGGNGLALTFGVCCLLFAISLKLNTVPEGP
jgi:hypothetical protein